MALSKRTAEEDRIFTPLYKQSDNDSTEKPLDVTLLKNTGRYKPVSLDKRPANQKLPGAIGSVEFSRIYYNSSYALGLVTIRDQTKNGVVKMILLEKRAGQWMKTSEDILEIW